MPSPWNEGTDRQLLLVIIALTSPSAPKWDQVALHMGEGFTAESTRQHFMKLRKETKTKYGDIGDSSGDKNTATPPPKGKGKGKTKTTTNGTPASKKRKTKASDDNDDDEEGEVKKEEAQDFA